MSCSNCLAAGAYNLCTKHVTSRGWIDADAPTHIEVVNPGQQSNYDSTYGGGIYDLYYVNVGMTSLVPIV